jgi:hypothetical protein
MPRVATSYVFHPTLQFRYSVFTSMLPTALIHARSAQQPSVDNSPVSIDHKNGYFKVKGKTKWNDITLSCYQFEGITVGEIWRYMNNKHQEIKEAKDKFADSYKHDMQLLLLNPLSIPISRWKLVGAFISNASWGDMDWGNNDVAQCQLTISYDYAELHFP